MKKIAIPLTAFLALLLTTSFALAGPGKRAGNCNGKGQHGQVMTYEQHKVQMDNRLERMGVVLDLTAPQKEQLRNLFDQQWKERQAMRNEIQSSRAAMYSARWDKNFDEKEFRVQAQKHADLKTDMMVDRAKRQQQIVAILTPEQQNKMEQLRGMEMGFQGKRGGMGHGMNSGFGQHSNNF